MYRYAIIVFVLPNILSFPTPEESTPLAQCTDDTQFTTWKMGTYYDSNVAYPLKWCLFSFIIKHYADDKTYLCPGIAFSPSEKLKDRKILEAFVCPDRVGAFDGLDDISNIPLNALPPEKSRGFWISIDQDIGEIKIGRLQDNEKALFTYNYKRKYGDVVFTHYAYVGYHVEWKILKKIPCY